MYFSETLWELLEIFVIALSKQLYLCFGLRGVKLNLLQRNYCFELKTPVTNCNQDWSWQNSSKASVSNILVLNLNEPAGMSNCSWFVEKVLFQVNYLKGICISRTFVTQPSILAIFSKLNLYFLNRVNVLRAFKQHKK